MLDLVILNLSIILSLVEYFCCLVIAKHDSSSSTGNEGDQIKATELPIIKLTYLFHKN